MAEVRQRLAREDHCQMQIAGLLKCKVAGRRDEVLDHLFNAGGCGGSLGREDHSRIAGYILRKDIQVACVIGLNGKPDLISMLKDRRRLRFGVMPRNFFLHNAISEH